MATLVQTSFFLSLHISLVKFPSPRRGSPSTDGRASRLASGPRLLAPCCICDLRILGHTRQVNANLAAPLRTRGATEVLRNTRVK